MASELVPIVRAATPKEIKSAVGNSLADVWQALIGDRVSSFRLQNAAKLSSKLDKILRERGHTVDWERVPDRFAVSWFEHATNEDDSEIQDLFAQLLANAAEGCDSALKRKNVEIVASLSSSDARLLRAINGIYREKIADKKEGYVWLASWHEFTMSVTKFGEVVEDISYETIQNLGIIEVERSSSLNQQKLERWVKGKIGQDGGGGLFTTYPVDDAIEYSDEVNVSRTGRSLLRAIFPEGYAESLNL